MKIESKQTYKLFGFATIPKGVSEFKLDGAPKEVADYVAHLIKVGAVKEMNDPAETGHFAHVGTVKKVDGTMVPPPPPAPPAPVECPPPVEPAATPAEPPSKSKK